MAKFQITGPSGEKFEATAPDGASEQDVMSYAKSQLGGGQPNQEPNTLKDTGLSFGSGVVRGGAMLAGTGGDLSKLAGAGIEGLRGAGVPVDQMKQEALSAMPGWLRKFHETPGTTIGSQDIMGGIDKAVGAPVTSYEPQTTTGTFARTVGEMTPGGLMGGAGFLRGALLPGLVSEGAGQATKGSSYETPARVLGAVLGGYVPKGATEAIANLGPGVGGKSLETAFSSGARGGDAGRAFRDNMRGNVSPDDVVADAKSAVRNMRADRSSQYEAGMSGVRADNTVLKFDDIDAALVKANKVKNFKGEELSKSTTAVRDDIQKQVDHWKSLNPDEFHTPAGLDALKQSIGDIKDSLPYNTPQRAVADQVYNSIRQTVAKQAPEYAKTMKGYESASTAIGEIEKTLSLNPKASVDTALRKLQSSTRNNVNTNYGKRADLVKALADNGAPDLLEKLAGQSMNAWTPRGINKIAATGAGLSSYMNPLALALLPAMSPRLVGETAHLAGRIAGAPGRAVRAATGIEAGQPLTPEISAMLSALLATRQ